MVGVQAKPAVKPDAMPNFVEHELHHVHSVMQLKKISHAFAAIRSY